MPASVIFPALILIAGGWSCADIKPSKTEVSVSLTVPEVYYDYSMSKKELTEFGQERLEAWKIEHGLTGSWYHFESNGAIMGGWAYSISYGMGAGKVDRYGTHWCPFFKTINMDVLYRTKIMVASDYKSGSCEFEKTMSRITQFHNSNTAVFDRYTGRLKQDLGIMAVHMEARGYSPRDKVEITFGRFRQGIKDAMDLYFSAMSDEIKQKSKLINTPEHVFEYSRDLRSCR